MEVSNSDEFESGEEDSQEEETDVKTLKSSLTQNRKSFKSDFLGTLSLSKLKQEKEEFLEKQKQEEIQKRKQEEQEKKRQLKLERKQEEKEKQLEEQEIMLKQIEQAFEYRYQEFLTNYLVARHDKDENLKEGIKLVQLLGKFREFTEPIVKEIINDLINKQESRKYKPKQIETFKQNENFQINQSYYEIQKEYTNLLIKIRYIQEEKPVASRKQSDYNYLNQDSNLGYSQTLQNTINNKNGDIYENNIQNYNNFNINRNTSLESSIQNNKKNKNIIQNLNICNTLDFDDYHIKELSNEFKVLNVVNNKILEIRKKQQQQQQKYEQLMKLKNQYQNQADFFLRVPLTVYFEYKGFKIMVQTFCPKNDQVIFGPQIKKYNESNNNNFDEMNQNLKNNELNSKYTQKQKQQDFPLQENAQNFQFNKQEKQINFEREKSKSNFEYKYHPQIEKQMEIIAQKLNIMPHRVFFKNQILNIPLQLEVQVHQVEQFQDIQKLIKEYKQKQAKVQILQQELLESYSSSSQHDSSQSSSNSFDSSNCSSQLENEQKIFEIHANLALQDEVLTDENDKRKKKGGEFEKQNVDQFFRLRQIQEDLQDEASSEQDQVIYDEQTKFNQNYSKQYQAINLDKKSYYLYDLKNIFPQNFDIELFFNQEQNNMLNLSLASYHNLNQNQIQQQHQNLNLKNLNMYVQKLRPSFIFNQEFSLNPDFMYTISNDKELNESIQQFNSNNSEENYQNYVQELTGDNQNQNLKNQNYDHQKFVFQQIQQSQIEKMQLGVVCKQIRLQILNTFIYDLDNSIYIPISGYDLSHEIHRRGLNIKYLGIICKKCESIYVKKICRQEMIARCLKKVIQGKLTDYIINKEINSSKEEGKVDNNQVNQFRRNIQQFFEDKVLQNGNNKGEKEENEDELLLNFTRDEHKQIKEEKIQSMLVISIFNQIFGQNEGTLFIWNTLLPNLLKKYFYFEEQKIDLLEFELGGLLNSLVINLKLKFKYGVNIFNNVNQSLKNSITDYQIFNEKNLIDFNIQGQSYDMNAVDLVTMSERANQKIQNLVFSRNKRDLQIKREEKLSDKSKLQQEDYKLKKNQKSQEQKQQRKEIIQMLKIKIIIQNQLYGEKCLENLDTQVQLAQIYYEDQQIEEAKHNARIILEKYKDIPFIQMVYGYCILIRCSLSNEDFQAIQNYCQQALQIIQFNLGGNHPISLEIYNTMVQCCTKLADDEGIIFYLEKIEDCLKNSIGMNSEHYGDCILDIGDQLFKMGKFEEAVKYYENFYFIFMSQIGKNNILCLYTRYQLLKSLFQLNKFKESLEICNDLLAIYMEKQKDNIENISDIMIIRIQINIKENKYDQSIKESDILWFIYNQNSVENFYFYKNLFECYLIIYYKNLNYNLKSFLNKAIEKYIDDLKNKLGQDYNQFGEKIKENCLNQILNNIRESKKHPMEYFEDIFLGIGQNNFVQPEKFTERNNILNENNNNINNNITINTNQKSNRNSFFENSKFQINNSQFQPQQQQFQFQINQQNENESNNEIFAGQNSIFSSISQNSSSGLSPPFIQQTSPLKFRSYLMSKNQLQLNSYSSNQEKLKEQQEKKENDQLLKFYEINEGENENIVKFRTLSIVLGDKFFIYELQYL